MSDKNFKTGAVRSADENFSYSSLPWLGIMMVARVSGGEGAYKYGRFNYSKGMPGYTYRDHYMHHIAQDNCGDRSITHLTHAAWGLLNEIQERILRPEEQRKHDLGPGMTLTPEMLAHMEEQAPMLKERRDAIKAEEAATGRDPLAWTPEDLPEVKAILAQRAAVEAVKTDKLAAIREAIAANPGDLKWSHEDDDGFAVIAESKINADHIPRCQTKAEHHKALKSWHDRYVDRHARTESHVPVKPAPAKPERTWSHEDDDGQF